jgi:hypothetical protein
LAWNSISAASSAKPARAVAGVDGHVDAGILEVALGSRMQEEGGRAFEAPVELELDRRGLRLGRAQPEAEGGSGKEGLEELSLVHR